jgi:hypothetical protein
MFTDKRRYTWRQQLAFSALLMYLYRVKKMHAEHLYCSCLFTFRQYAPGNLSILEI